MVGVARSTGGAPYQRVADGMWCVAIELPSEGTKRRRKVIVRARRDDVIRAKRAALKELARTGDLPTASPTLAMWLDLWLRRRAGKLKPRTAETYAGYVERYLKPTLGKVRVDKLTVAHVHKLHDAILAQGLSTTTALQAHRILAKALTDAERAGKVTRNVATLTDAPSRAYNPRAALTAQEAAKLLVSVANDPRRAAHWGVALMAGLRQGERLGLTYDAVNLNTGTITVSWQLQRLKWQHGCLEAGKVTCGRKQGGACPDKHVDIPTDQEAQRVYGGLWLTRPKSKTGWREVPIADELGDALAAYMRTTTPGDAGLLFHRGDGHPIDPRDDSAGWDADLRAAGVPDVPLHSARHTTSSLLFYLDVPEQIRMQILGHSSAAVTRGYTHVTDPQARAAMNRLGGLLTPAPTDELPEVAE